MISIWRMYRVYLYPCAHQAQKYEFLQTQQDIAYAGHRIQTISGWQLLGLTTKSAEAFWKLGVNRRSATPVHEGLHLVVNISRLTLEQGVRARHKKATGLAIDCNLDGPVGLTACCLNGRPCKNSDGRATEAKA